MTDDAAAPPASQPAPKLHPGYLDRIAQEQLVAAVRDIIRQAPLFPPRMPRTGSPFSVRMTNCGRLGWVSDIDGYRYQETHPLTGQPWPPIPELLLKAWSELGRYPHEPEACLINYYGPAAKMGLHQDRDENDLQAPVVSLSLGDTCIFRYAGIQRRGPTHTLRLASGDAMVLANETRLAFHGVDRIVAGTSTLLAEGGRFNLTLRRVTEL
ncbi:MAG: alpha-ketoglutarate-dependent dioxygenase AlkB [Xanthobacteraceae bacterium]|nr:alpha-ketoglutarate-dependent dioxygenase AlkB [Xanthobacteraceae bacterium]MBV9632483.1 alpha-ketoglutarate-dependent dioxygenase AlkB [Xanthobacteraceae bacterium]